MAENVGPLLSWPCELPQVPLENQQREPCLLAIELQLGLERITQALPDPDTSPIDRRRTRLELVNKWS